MDRRKFLTGIGWDPSYLHPLAWYFADISYLTVDSAGKISQWSDRSGNGNHVTQSTAILRPVINPASWNQLLSVGFSGYSLAKSGGSVCTQIAGTDVACSILATYAPGTFSNPQALFAWGNGGGGVQVMSGGITTTHLTIFTREDDTGTTKTSSPTYPVFDFLQHLRLAWAFTGTTVTTYVNGVPASSGANVDVGACTFTDFSIGDTVRAGSPLQGNLMELVVVPGILQASDAGAYQSYSTQVFGP